MAELVGRLVKAQTAVVRALVGQGWGQRICTGDRLPGDTDAASAVIPL